MPSLNRNNLVTRIGELIGDPNNTLWSENKKITVINEGEERFVMDTKVLTSRAETTSTAAQQTYSIPSSSKIFDILRVTVAGIELAKRSQFDIDSAYDNAGWEDLTAETPTSYYLRIEDDNYELVFFPKIKDSGKTIRYEFVKLPTAMSSGTDIPFDSHTLLLQFHPAIAYYGASVLLKSGSGPFDLATAATKSAMYEREYRKYVDLAIENTLSLQEREQPRMYGGRYFKNL